MDDVTKDKPLNGGRQRANHIQVHRVELGLWERKNLGKPVSELAESAAKIGETIRIVQTAAVVGGAVAAGATAYALYKIGKAAYGWTEDIYDEVKKRQDVTQAVGRGIAMSPAGGVGGIFARIFGIGDGKGVL